MQLCILMRAGIRALYHKRLEDTVGSVSLRLVFRQGNLFEGNLQWLIRVYIAQSMVAGYRGWDAAMLLVVNS
jgi:hypothetical protein